MLNPFTDRNNTFVDETKPNEFESGKINNKQSLSIYGVNKAHSNSRIYSVSSELKEMDQIGATFENFDNNKNSLKSSEVVECVAESKTACVINKCNNEVSSELSIPMKQVISAADTGNGMLNSDDIASVASSFVKPYMYSSNVQSGSNAKTCSPFLNNSYMDNKIDYFRSKCDSSVKDNLREKLNNEKKTEMEFKKLVQEIRVIIGSPSVKPSALLRVLKNIYMLDLSQVTLVRNPFDVAQIFQMRCIAKIEPTHARIQRMPKRLLVCNKLEQLVVKIWRKLDISHVNKKYQFKNLSISFRTNAANVDIDQISNVQYCLRYKYPLKYNMMPLTKTKSFRLLNS
ncbi:uncharacterized protein LOC119689580 isoform X2 [Teleopsis dalmanni]|uniref:uncharacterized protein LOC119689580 isoform X2 n=1 Tax=Teleopsis dalmanni TaxID=139649 RepID=UPI0018CCAEC3|nr:uncharacterized protein LOC119689580 isoform X2 [Teleopsis dalmanni]